MWRDRFGMRECIRLHGFDDRGARDWAVTPPRILDRGSLASVAGRGREHVKSSSLNVASSDRISSGVLCGTRIGRARAAPDTGQKLGMDGHLLIRAFERPQRLLVGLALDDPWVGP